MKKIKIPEYDVIAPSIESDAFIGWKYKARIYENLYFLIEYVNYQVIGQEKVKNPFWVFSFCNDKEQPISRVFVPTSIGNEKSYRVGIVWLLRESKKIGKELCSLADNLELAY